MLIITKKNGMAVILALFLVSIASSLCVYLIVKQDLLFLKVAQQKYIQNLNGLSYGVVLWAKNALIQNLNENDIDYRAKNLNLNIKNMKISNILYKNEIAYENDSIYLSSYIEDAQSKFNINNLIVWQNIGNNKRIPSSINEKYFYAYQNLLKNLNINKNLAWQTVYYIFSSYNLYVPKLNISSLDDNRPSSVIKDMGVIFAKYPNDLLYMGYSNEEIKKLRPYITFIAYDTKINVNTAQPLVLKSLIPNINKDDVFEQNINLYAKNINEAINYLQINPSDTESINIANNYLDVKTHFIDLYAILNSGEYNKKIFARINQRDKKIEDYLDGTKLYSIYNQK